MCMSWHEVLVPYERMKGNGSSTKWYVSQGMAVALNRLIVLYCVICNFQNQSLHLCSSPHVQLQSQCRCLISSSIDSVCAVWISSHSVCVCVCVSVSVCSVNVAWVRWMNTCLLFCRVLHSQWLYSWHLMERERETDVLCVSRSHVDWTQRKGPASLMNDAVLYYLLAFDVQCVWQKKRRQQVLLQPSTKSEHFSFIFFADSFHFPWIF